MTYINNDSFSLAQNRDIRVLVAHSDPRLCETICVALRMEGYATCFGTTEDSADLEMARKDHEVHAVICSQDFFSMIARHRVCRVFPIMVVQDSISLDDAMNSIRHGAVDVIGLPLDVERMLRGLKGSLSASNVETGVGRGAAGFRNLTPRERQVLDLLLQGKSNKDAALELDISPRTVEVHRARVMEKVRAKNAVDLARIAYGHR